MALTLIPALLLGLLAVGIVAAFIKLFVNATVGDLRSFRDGFSLRHRKQLLSEIDKHLDRKDTSSAVALLPSLFMVNPWSSEPKILEQINSYHSEVLNRILTIAELGGHRLQALPLLEDLLTTRSDLLRARGEVINTKRGLRLKRLSSGKATPDWAMNEFSKKLLEINDRLVINERSLEAQIAEIKKALYTSPSPERVTYH